VRHNTAIRKILVAVKEPRGRLAPYAIKAAQIASACGASVELFHTIATPVLTAATGSRPSLGSLMRTLRQAALADLEKLAGEFRKRGVETRCSAAWDYPPHEAIIRHALHVGADLIVAKCRARHRLRALLGYTDWSLVRDSPLPVLLLKSDDRYMRPTVLAAIDPTHRYAKPADLDRLILHEAARIGRAFGTRPHVMHAFLPPSYAALPDVMPAVVGDAIDSEAVTTARRNFRSALRGMAIPLRRRHLVEADPVTAITSTARKVNADIVVLGAVSRRGLKQLFIGDTAERVLDELRCDLLVVKSDHFTSRVARASRGAFVVAPMGFA